MRGHNGALRVNSEVERQEPKPRQELQQGAVPRVTAGKLQHVAAGGGAGGCSHGIHVALQRHHLGLHRGQRVRPGCRAGCTTPILRMTSWDISLLKMRGLSMCRTDIILLKKIGLHRI